jgi:hypothetical protein
MFNHPSAIAALVALLAGWGLIQSTRSMLFEGVEVRDGGGFVVIILVETMVFLTAIAIAVA